MPLYASNLLNAFLLAVVLILLLQKIAGAIGLVDLPTARKLHEGSVPVIGGLAMFTAVLAPMLLLDRSLQAPWEFVAGLSILVVLGVVDDRYDISARIKLIVQILAVLVMVVPHEHIIREIGIADGRSGLELHGLAIPFTVLFAVGLVNAFNMMDGADGLAGGIAASGFFWLTVVAVTAGRSEQVVLLLLLFATLGFLVFNMRHPWCARATVFMGDAGSMMLGACVAFFIIQLSPDSERPHAVSFAALLWACALPAIDTLSLIVRRLRAGRSPVAADREHLHHLLLDLGIPPHKVTLIIITISFVLGGVGVAGSHFGLSTAFMVSGLMILFAVHTTFVLLCTAWIEGARQNADALATTSQPIQSSAPQLMVLSNPSLGDRSA